MSANANHLGNDQVSKCE